MNQPPYETSSTYVGGMVKSLQGAGLLDAAVNARLDAEQRAIVQSPWAKPWWPGPVTEGIVEAVLAVHGREALERASFETVVQSVGPIITPLMSVIGAIFGMTPSTLFERMGEFASTSVRGITISWRSTGARAGELAVTYPAPLSPAIELLWRGSCRYVFQAARVEGRIDTTRIEGSTITMHVSWA